VLGVAAAVLLGALAALFFLARKDDASQPAAVRSLDGSGNNVDHPDWGEIVKQYVRVAKPNYADGIGRMVNGPSSRYISNRIFNDIGQNLLSERNVSQWGWVWGQFLDHTFGLRDERPGESAPIGFDSADPDERFRDDLRKIDFSRTRATPGTGTATVPRQETNTVSSYIDAFSIYGGTPARLEWLRDGPVDGTLSDNKATLFLPGDYLPQANARGNAAKAPAMDLMGALVGHPASAVVSGDVRANENIGLTAVHTLFAREHNRIVSMLPKSLSEATKFQIARRVVGAEEQYITYQEFLPALGIYLPPYRGYDPTVNASISNEFATVGYRMHSMCTASSSPRCPSAPTGKASWPRSPRAASRSSAKVTRSSSSFHSDSPTAIPPCSSRSASGHCSPGSEGSGSTETTSRSTTRCGASSSRSPSRGRVTPRSAARLSSSRAVSPSCWISARSTSSGAATTACPTTTRCASPMD
jgi:hypothetical protein